MIEEVLKEYAEKLTALYKEKLLQSEDTGNLISSVSFDIKKNGQDYEIVLNLEDYWKYIEEGREEGKFPPRNEILKWIETKPILPRPYVLPSGSNIVPTNMQLAYLIGRKIANEGIEGKHYLQDVLDNDVDSFIKDLTKALAQDVMEQLLTEFNK